MSETEAVTVPVSSVPNHNNGIQKKNDGSPISKSSPKELQSKYEANVKMFLRRNSRSSCSSQDSGNVENNMKLQEDDFVRRRSASVLEVKAQATNRLHEELLKAQKDLQLKDEEVKKLNSIQDQMNEEIEDLTAKLFEEANNMVQDANIKRMKAEKLLKESNAKNEVLQAEVAALKALVLTSTPSMPNKHLHPQLDVEPKEGNRLFVKGHRRSTSHHNLRKSSGSDSNDSKEPPVTPTTNNNHGKNVDPMIFNEFKNWIAKSPRSIDMKNKFLSRIYNEDILPCMSFPDLNQSQNLIKSMSNNTLMIEPLPSIGTFPVKCSLTHASLGCPYRIKIGESDEWSVVSDLVRNRITAVCDFFTYVRYITQGLVKTDEGSIYWELMRLRKEMSLARLGLTSS